MENLEKQVWIKQAKDSHIWKIFKKIRDATSKEGYFVGSETRELFQDEKFDEINKIERIAWLSSKQTAQNFWEITNQKTTEML